MFSEVEVEARKLPFAWCHVIITQLKYLQIEVPNKKHVRKVGLLRGLRDLPCRPIAKLPRRHVPFPWKRPHCCHDLRKCHLTSIFLKNETACAHLFRWFRCLSNLTLTGYITVCFLLPPPFVLLTTKLVVFFLFYFLFTIIKSEVITTLINMVCQQRWA